MPYTVKLISKPMQSGTKLSWLLLSQSLSKSGERRLESLSNKNPHIVHDRASSDCKAVSRSFPYGFHLPSPQFNIDMVAVRDLLKRRKERPSVNHLKLQLSAHRPQPTARISTHLSRLKFGGRRPKSKKGSILPTLFNGLMSHCRRGQSEDVH